MFKTLLFLLLATIAVQSMPASEFENGASKAIGSLKGAFSDPAKAANEGLTNLQGAFTNTFADPAKAVDKGLTNVQGAVKNTFGAAGDITSVLQNHLIGSVKEAETIVKQSVDEQGETISESVKSVLGTSGQLTETGINLFSSIPKLGFHLLAAFGG